MVDPIQRLLVEVEQELRRNRFDETRLQEILSETASHLEDSRQAHRELELSDEESVRSAVWSFGEARAFVQSLLDATDREPPGASRRVVSLAALSTIYALILLLGCDRAISEIGPLYLFLSFLAIPALVAVIALASVPLRRPQGLSMVAVGATGTVLLLFLGSILYVDLRPYGGVGQSPRWNLSESSAVDAKTYEYRKAELEELDRGIEAFVDGRPLPLGLAQGGFAEAPYITLKASQARQPEIAYHVVSLREATKEWRLAKEILRPALAQEVAIRHANLTAGDKARDGSWIRNLLALSPLMATFGSAWTLALCAAHYLGVLLGRLGRRLMRRWRFA